MKFIRSSQINIGVSIETQVLWHTLKAELISKHTDQITHDSFLAVN